MWWSGFGRDDFWADQLAEDSARIEHAAETKPAYGGPTPGEVFFEAGVILAPILGAALLATFLLKAFGIPVD